MSLHEDACGVLTGWNAPDAEQEALRQTYLAHLAAHPDALERSCHPDHLTASALLFSADASAVLLTLHARLGRWLQTGGHCEDDADLAAAARRELIEESGIETVSVDPVPVLLSRHEVPCGPLRPAHHLDVQYAAVAAGDSTPVVSEESIDVRWFPIDALPDVDDSVRALVAAGARRLRESPVLAPSADSD